MNVAATANPRVAIGNNSRAAEFAVLAEVIRAEMNLAGMSPVWRARWEILLSDMDTHDKLVNIVMSFFADNEGHNARPGMKKLQHLTSMSERRVRLALRLSEEVGFLAKQGGGYRSKASVYTVQVPERTILELSQMGERRHNMPPIKDGIGGKDCTEGVPFHEKGGTDDPKRLHPRAPQPIENLNNKKHTPLPPKQSSGLRWEQRDPFGLNQWQAAEHEDVKLDEEFRLHVHNGFQSELLEKLQPVGLDLREALDEAAKYVPSGAPPAQLKIAVRSQITRLAREAKERADLRAARAAQKPPPTNDWHSQKQAKVADGLDTSEVIRKLAEQVRGKR